MAECSLLSFSGTSVKGRHKNENVFVCMCIMGFKVIFQYLRVTLYYVLTVNVPLLISKIACTSNNSHFIKCNKRIMDFEILLFLLDLMVMLGF